MQAAAVGLFINQLVKAQAALVVVEQVVEAETLELHKPQQQAQQILVAVVEQAQARKVQITQAVTVALELLLFVIQILLVL
jgi:hypothetical protein